MINSTDAPKRNLKRDIEEWKRQQDLKSSHESILGNSFKAESAGTWWYQCVKCDKFESGFLQRVEQCPHCNGPVMSEDIKAKKSRDELWAEAITTFRRDRSVHKSGPKGPRDRSIQRRLRIVALYAKGIKGRKACAELTHQKVPLPTEELQLTYRGNWILWYQANPKAVYRQLSDDRRRAPKHS